MALLPGVVVVPGPVRDGQMAATVHEHGLRIPVTLPVDRLGRSNRPESPEPGPVTTLLLGGDSRLHFAGERVDLSTSVSTLSLRKKDDAAVEFATSCGEYRLLREPPAEGGSSSSAGSTSGSSDTSLILGIGVIGGSESSGTLSGSVSSFDEVGSVAVGTASEPAATSIPSGTTVSWPDGAALDPLPRNLLTFDPRPTPTDDGRVCYDVTLSMWACPSCQDNVTLCFAAP
jgi:hypothetical protein